jgi:hypothetical protein
MLSTSTPKPACLTGLVVDACSLLGKHHACVDVDMLSQISSSAFGTAAYLYSCAVPRCPLAMTALFRSLTAV